MIWCIPPREHHAGELFPHIGSIVTNLETPSRAVGRFYNKRGTAEQLIKVGNQAVKVTRLSCHRFRSSEVRLWLGVIAHNLRDLWRGLTLPKKIENLSLIRGKGPRNRCEMGQSMAFLSRQMSCRTRPVPWFRKKCKMDCERM